MDPLAFTKYIYGSSFVEELRSSTSLSDFYMYFIWILKFTTKLNVSGDVCVEMSFFVVRHMYISQ